MFVNTNDCTVGYTSFQRLKKAAREMIRSTNPDDLYIKYYLYVPPKKLQGIQSMTKHIINWLYTVRCESGATGLRYINIVLNALSRTLRRDLNDLQKEYVFGLIDIFHAERNLYK